MLNRNKNTVRLTGMFLLTIMLACNTGVEKNGPTCGDSACTDPAHRGTQLSGPDSFSGTPVLIAGVVYDQQGKPVAHAQVTIYGKTTTADANGTFFVAPVDLFDNRSNVQLKEGPNFFPARGAYF